MAHDKKELHRWQAFKRRASAQTESVGLTGAALERVVMGLAHSHPDLVAVRS